MLPSSVHLCRQIFDPSLIRTRMIAGHREHLFGCDAYYRTSSPTQTTPSLALSDESAVGRGQGAPRHRYTMYSDTTTVNGEAPIIREQNLPLEVETLHT